MGWGRQTVVKGYLPYLIYKLESECGDSSVPVGIGVVPERVGIRQWSLAIGLNVNVVVVVGFTFLPPSQTVGPLGAATGFGITT